MHRLFLSLITVLLLSACEEPEIQLGPDGKPLPKLYRIYPSDVARIQYDMLDSINALRASAGRKQLTLDANLTAAAATHSRDMFKQNRPWHFGSDGSSPIDRIARAGYDGLLIGETISETYETEFETLAAWMESPATRDIIMDSRATDMGFSWHQESVGKIWWTLVVGQKTNAPVDLLSAEDGEAIADEVYHTPTEPETLTDEELAAIDALGDDLLSGLESLE